MEIEKRRQIDGWRKLSNIVPVRTNLPPISIKVGNAIFRIDVCGASSIESHAFVSEYYNKWLVQSGRPPDWTVTLHTLPAPFDNENHEIWTSKLPYCTTASLEDKGTLIFQRDFAALISKDRQSLTAWVPRLHIYATDSLDNLLLYLLTETLYKYDGLILHSCAVARNDKAHVFYGVSGAGKSTLAIMSKEVEKMEIISEDKTLLTLKDDKLYASSLPLLPNKLFKYRDSFCHRELPVNTLAHLKGKHSDFKFEKKKPVQIYSSLLPEVLDLDPGRVPAQSVLNLATRMITHSGLLLGELSYRKGFSFWPELDRMKTNPEEPQ